MRSSDKVTRRSRRKIAARGSRACRDVGADTVAATIRQFDRAEPTPPTKEIQLMTEEERKIYTRPSTY
jgi:hypothetical protein